jgi:hypothetical protein
MFGKIGSGRPVPVNRFSGKHVPVFKQHVSVSNSKNVPLVKIFQQFKKSFSG